MFVPEQYRISEPAEVLSLMRANPFAALISHDSDGLIATHLPTVTRREGELLVVEFHLARSNPHWKRLAANSDAEAMLIFSGPEAYIRPGWYPSKAEAGKAVPTWNYAIVHAYGRAEVIEDGAWLLRHVTELSAQQESPYEMQWRTSDAPAQFIALFVPRGVAENSHHPPSFTKVCGSKDNPRCRISKWSCGAVERPVLPLSPITWPGATLSSAATKMRDRWPYMV